MNQMRRRLDQMQERINIGNQKFRQKIAQYSSADPSWRTNSVATNSLISNSTRATPISNKGPPAASSECTGNTGPLDYRYTDFVLENVSRANAPCRV